MVADSGCGSGSGSGGGGSGGGGGGSGGGGGGCGDRRNGNGRRGKRVIRKGETRDEERERDAAKVKRRAATPGAILLEFK